MSDVEPVVGQPPKTEVPENLRGIPGRPSKLTDLQKAEVYNALQQYILETDDPTIPGFLSENEVALKYHINDSNLYDWQEFPALIKQAVRKQEAYLLKQAGAGKYNPAIAIFRLKQPQHGYRDKVETDITSKGNEVGIGLTPLQAQQLLNIKANEVDPNAS